jgi:hypothetical protein
MSPYETLVNFYDTSRRKTQKTAIFCLSDAFSVHSVLKKKILISTVFNFGKRQEGKVCCINEVAYLCVLMMMISWGE